LVVELVVVFFLFLEQREQLLGRRGQQRRRRAQRERVAARRGRGRGLGCRVPRREPLFSVRLDPWAAEYESGLQLTESDDEPFVEVDTTVETDDWRPLRPGPGPRPATLAFVDGVRRVEHRLLLESEEERTVF